MPEHHHHGHEGLTGARLGWTLVLNLLITVVEFAGGLISGSMALVTDALHNLSDVVSLLVSYAAVRAARRPKSLDFTFGWKRAQILAAVLNSSVLVVVALFMIIKAIERFAHPTDIAGNLMVMIAGLGLVANVVGTLLLKKGAGQNMNIRSSYLHLLSDAVSSAGVILGGIGIMIWHVVWIDPVVTILISLYILRESVLIIWGATDILMMKTPADIDADRIRRAVENVAGVRNLHHVHMWQIDEHDRHFEGHVEMEDMTLARATETLATLENLLADRFGFQHSVLQIETERGHPGDLVTG